MWVPVLHYYPIEEVLLFKVNLPSCSTLLLPVLNHLLLLRVVWSHCLYNCPSKSCRLLLNHPFASPSLLKGRATSSGLPLATLLLMGPIMQFPVLVIRAQALIQVSISLVFPKCQKSFSKMLLFRQLTH